MRFYPYAKLFHNKLIALGLPKAYATHCTLESVEWARLRISQGKPEEVPGFFRLRRAEYCLRRHGARWGFTMKSDDEKNLHTLHISC